MNDSILKVILLGDGCVGKTSLIQQYINKIFNPNPYHTIGVEFSVKDIELDGCTYTIQLWDTAGQERYRTLRTPFYRGCDICIFTFDVCNMESFKNLDSWYDEFVRYSHVKSTEIFPFLVFGNKSDLEDREVTYQEVIEWCKEKSKNIQSLSKDEGILQSNLINHGFPYIETSAKTAENVDVGFETSIKLWVELDKKASKARTENYDLTRPLDLRKGKEVRGGCC